MFGWDEAEQSHDKVYGKHGQPPEHEAHLSHEVIAGAASFEAFKVYEDHQRAEGKEVSHQFGKELLAGFAGAEVDRLAETKGMDEVDKLEAKHKAKQGARKMYDDQYGGEENYNPNKQGPHKNLKKKFPKNFDN